MSHLVLAIPRMYIRIILHIARLAGYLVEGSVGDKMKSGKGRKSKEREGTKHEVSAVSISLVGLLLLIPKV